MHRMHTALLGGFLGLTVAATSAVLGSGAAQAVPLDAGVTTTSAPSRPNLPAPALGNWLLFLSYVVFSLGLDGVLLLIMIWLFNTRWRVAG